MTVQPNGLRCVSPAQHVLAAAGVAAVHPTEQRQHVQRQQHGPQQPAEQPDERHIHGVGVLARLALHGTRTGECLAHSTASLDG